MKQIKSLLLAGLLSTVFAACGGIGDAMTDSGNPMGLERVKNLNAVPESKKVTLTWQEQPEKYFDHIEIRFSSIKGNSDPIIVSKGANTCSVSSDLGAMYELSNGTLYTFTVVEVDIIGNKSPVSRVQATPFDGAVKTAVLLNTPANPTNQTSINITVTGDDVVAYSYNLDSMGWSGEIPATTAITGENLSEGIHALEVLAKSSSGIWQKTQALYTWSVDTSAQIALLLGTPCQKTTFRSINILVGGNAIVSYKYKIDGASAWSEECLTTVPITAYNLGVGNHQLYVIGKNNAGTWQSVPTQLLWTVTDSLSIKSITSTFAGDISSTSQLSDGVGSNARFTSIRDMVCDGANIYLFELGLIRKVNIETNMVTTIAGDLSKPQLSTSNDGTGAQVTFKNIQGITCDSFALYIIDSYCIRKLNKATNEVTTIAGSSAVSGDVDGFGTNSKLYDPTAITTDNFYLYITDGNAIKRINLSNGYTEKLYGNTAGSVTADSQLITPKHIITDNTYLYIHDRTGPMNTLSIWKMRIDNKVLSKCCQSSINAIYFCVGANVYYDTFSDMIIPGETPSSDINVLNTITNIASKITPAKFPFRYSSMTTDGTYVYLGRNNQITRVE